MGLKQLPEQERPRERLANLGPEALSVPELIAIVLGSGTKGKTVLTLAQELFSKFGSLKELAQASIEDLCQVRGLGKIKAIQLMSALTLARRLQKEHIPTKCKIHTAETAYHWVKDHLIYETREIFGVILQDAKGQAFKWNVVSVGTLTQTLVHPREVFYPAIHHLAAGIILAHNHPSGDVSPSASDLHLTRQLIQASKSIGIPIHDHLIVTKKGYLSLKEEGYFF